MMYYYGWAAVLGGIVMVIFWIAVIALIVWLIRRAFMDRHSWRDWHRNDNAMNILKERYAKGEINKEEFEAKKKDLMM